MRNSFYAFLQDLTYLDLIDVLLVSVFFYYILLALKWTKAIQILQGLLALFVLQGIAYIFQLQTLSYILNGILVSTMVALPVVFQPELRRALSRLGQQGGIIGSTAIKEVDGTELKSMIDEIAFAAVNLSGTRFGALIVLERETGLQEIIDTGQLIKGVISAKLLQTIFWPKTPLHDGAVIIRGNEILAAACYLPLTDSVVDSRFGTRHRAAIGISEQTDAVIVVVSEETGEIRIARDGIFSQPMTEEAQVRKALSRELSNKTRKTEIDVRKTRM
ncbi:diadenylate cyclase CdaA [bacterium]|nr:diadenylate cyclase CdaA [bacterium]